MLSKIQEKKKKKIVTEKNAAKGKEMEKENDFLAVVRHEGEFGVGPFEAYYTLVYDLSRRA